MQPVGKVASSIASKKGLTRAWHALCGIPCGTRLWSRPRICACPAPCSQGLAAAVTTPVDAARQTGRLNQRSLDTTAGHNARPLVAIRASGVQPCSHFRKTERRHAARLVFLREGNHRDFLLVLRLHNHAILLGALDGVGGVRSARNRLAGGGLGRPAAASASTDVRPGGHPARCARTRASSGYGCGMHGLFQQNTGFAQPRLSMQGSSGAASPGSRHGGAIRRALTRQLFRHGSPAQLPRAPVAQ